MRPVLYCGHSQEQRVRHDDRRLEFGTDYLLPLGERVAAMYLTPFPRRARRFKPGWPKGWPKPPTWTFTWFR